MFIGKPSQQVSPAPAACCYMTGLDSTGYLPARLHMHTNCGSWKILMNDADGAGWAGQLAHPEAYPEGRAMLACCAAALYVSVVLCWVSGSRWVVVSVLMMCCSRGQCTHTLTSSKAAMKMLRSYHFFSWSCLCASTSHAVTDGMLQEDSKWCCWESVGYCWLWNMQTCGAVNSIFDVPDICQLQPSSA